MYYTDHILYNQKQDVSKDPLNQDEGDNMAVVKLRLSEVVAQWLERVWVDFHYSEVMVSDNS